MGNYLSQIEKPSAERFVDKPPTLNPEVVRALLEQRFQIMLSRKEADMDFSKRLLTLKLFLGVSQRLRIIWSKEASASNFLKCLFISKRFFNTTRRYPIFCLAICYRSKEVALALMNLSIFKLPPTREDFKRSDNIILSYQKMNSLISMLKPKHFIMKFLNDKVSTETLTKAVEHLDHIHGKIALYLRGDFQTKFSLLLDKFSLRTLAYLKCSPDFLTRSNGALKIGHYSSKFPVNNVQLLKVLSYGVDSLKCMINGDFIDEAQILTSSDQCNSLKYLHITCDEHYDSLMAFLDMVKDQCPKLQTIHINDFITSEDDEFDVSGTDEIMDRILAAQVKVQKISEKCHSFASSLEISSFVPVLYFSAEEFSCDWIDRAKTLDWFKGGMHKEITFQVNDHHFNICVLASEFDDGFLELNHGTMVFRVLQE